MPLLSPVTWVYRKYLVHISNNLKPLPSSHKSMFWRYCFQKNCKVWRNEKYWRFNIVLKSELGCSCEVSSGGVPKIVSLIYPFFKPHKISFKTLTLIQNLRAILWVEIYDIIKTSICSVSVEIIIEKSEIIGSAESLILPFINLTAWNSFFVNNNCKLSVNPEDDFLSTMFDRHDIMAGIQWRLNHLKQR